MPRIVSSEALDGILFAAEAEIGLLAGGVSMDRGRGCRRPQFHPAWQRRLAGVR